MSAKTQIEKEIREAVVFLRENNQTIPSETIQFMKEASIEKLNQGQTLPNIKEKLEELKQLCIDNADHQSGMDDDGGFYESMDFLKIEEIVEMIDEMLKD